MKHLVWLLLATATLAGCTDDSGDTAPACDPVSNYVDAATGECLPHVEPSIVISGLPESLEQYQTTEISWSLDPGTRGADGEVVHSMDSRILVGMEGAITDNTTAPDDWGTEIARQQHKDLPQNFTTNLRWDEVGSLFVKGYMLIDAVHVWTDLGTMTVTQVTASGNRTDVTISAGQPSLSSSETTVIVGDGVTFTNNHEFIAYTLAFDDEGCPAGGALAAGGGSLDVDFLAPGSCSYTLTTQGSGSGVTQGDLSGKVTVVAP